MTISPRTTYILVSLVVAMLIIALLSMVFEPGSTVGVLLLDLQTKDKATFPYPLTIQNIMYLLTAFGLGDALFRRSVAIRERAAMDIDVLPTDPAAPLLTKKHIPTLLAKNRQLQQTHPGFLSRAIDECLLYFQSNNAPDQTHSVLTSLVDLELHRVDLKYTMLRYIIWAIPTFGFIGTVVGIAQALGEMQGQSSEALSDALQPVIGHLAMAFNTTIMSLALSAILVLVVQTTQRREEEAINDCSMHCLRHLINRLVVPERVHR